MTTNLDISCMVVENTAETPAESSVGLDIDHENSKDGSPNATVTDTTVRGWGRNIIGTEVIDRPGTCGAVAPVTRDVNGHATAFKWNRKVRVNMFASVLPNGAVEARGSPGRSRLTAAGCSPSRSTPTARAGGSGRSGRTPAVTPWRCSRTACSSRPPRSTPRPDAEVRCSQRGR